MKKATLFFLVTFVILSGVFCVYLFSKNNKKDPLPIYGQIKDFQLIDSNKDRFQYSQLKDKIWVADFFFTTCGTICPIMSKNMQSLYGAYKSNPIIEFVSISVNPEQDTPDVLAEYAKRYQANTDTWHFLTGPREDIKDLTVNSFKIGSIEDPIFHSANFVLVDKSGRIRGYYDGTVREEIMELSNDLGQLLKEK